MKAAYAFVCQSCPARLYTKNPNCANCSQRAPNDRPKCSDANYLDHYNRTNLPGLRRFNIEK
jgi:predicted amidophosphoribosyltransferase